MNQRIDTEHQTPAGKEELFRSSHPVIRMLRELPQVIFPGDEERLPEEACSLKCLFGREMMDRYHVDRQRLFSIALSMASLMEGFRQRHICPGLLDFEDLLVDPARQDSPVYIIHPQRFQLLFFEQDYEWYPEDERLLGEGLFFDEERQLLADQRLIYRILIGSCRGNIKVPPARSDVDYAHIFYEQLPEDWKERFARHEVWSHMQMIDQIKKQMMLSQAETTAARFSLKEEEPDRAPSSSKKGSLFSTFVLLRTQLRHPMRLEKILFQTLEELENESEMTGRRSFLSFVYGDQVVEARDFQEYPRGCRFELSPDIRDYSFGEALVIARDIISDNMARRSGEDCSHRLYILLDGRIKNDQILKKMVDDLEQMKDKGFKVFLVESGECYCEAKEQICRLLD